MKQQPRNDLNNDAILLLQRLISTPSFSREEDRTAAIIESFLSDKGVTTQRHLNNVWAANRHYSTDKPTILLNSHHDTVKVNDGYTNDPFSPIVRDGRLYGLGSNDAGGSLVSLLTAFLHYYNDDDLRYNLIFAATAEEEISGPNGITALLPQLPKIDCGIVGEPTMMNMAIAEKGLLVLDCVAHGAPGHAARNDGENAIYKAMKDIEWFQTFNFQKTSALLGPVKMSVTMINGGLQHNVIPGACNFTVDCRINECYTHEEILEIVKQNVTCDVNPRSLRLRSTAISLGHPLVIAGLKLDRTPYGSPTLSDKALMPFPALKMGPGDSSRSHMADEYVYIDEITAGIGIYIQLLNDVL